MLQICVPEEKINIIGEADICVIGGSCTGVFAAVRAARLGAKVILIEKQNRFGGVATCGLVSMWHNLFDAHGERQIIRGLTFEMLERLEHKSAVSPFREPHQGISFNSEELVLELDKLALENRLEIHLDTLFTRVVMKDDFVVDSVVIENKSGRGAIRAKVFIDASGDGLLCSRAGFSMRVPARVQPATACARILNWQNLGAIDLKALIEKYRGKYSDLPCGYYWNMYIPGTMMLMLAGTRVMNCNTLDAQSLTKAELDSRRQIDALMCMLRDEYPEAGLSLQTLPSAIGVRETAHIDSIRRITGEELITGTHFEDAIANGTYPIDIHDDSSDMISFRYLNGLIRTFKASRLLKEERLIPEGSDYPPFYQIPLGSIIPYGSNNVISAGRMIDADRDAFGAVRVMVNLNQCGEAAGVLAYLVLSENSKPSEIKSEKIRSLLANGGSIIF